MNPYSPVVLRVLTGLYFFLVGVKLLLDQKLQGTLSVMVPTYGPILVIIAYWFMILIGLLLILGGITRFAAFVAVVTVIGSLVYSGWQEQFGLLMIKDIVLLGATVSLLLGGAGKWSFDSLLDQTETI
jgi:uncharacterized membrane protein YphA (DoxX/SURF4 family)